MTARDYTYRMLDIRSIRNSEYFMIEASNEQIEACMIAFAQEKVQEALKAAQEIIGKDTVPSCSDHTPFWGVCQTCGRYDNPEIPADEETIKESILKAYPLENVK